MSFINKSKTMSITNPPCSSLSLLQIRLIAILHLQLLYSINMVIFVLLLQTEIDHHCTVWNSNRWFTNIRRQYDLLLSYFSKYQPLLFDIHISMQLDHFVIELLPIKLRFNELLHLLYFIQSWQKHQNSVKHILITCFVI